MSDSKKKKVNENGSTGLNSEREPMDNLLKVNRELRNKVNQNLQKESTTLSHQGVDDTQKYLDLIMNILPESKKEE